MIEITKTVCDFFKISFEDVFKNTRKRNVIQAKEVSIYFIRKQHRKSFTEMGVFFNRDHATIIHNNKSVINQLETNSDFRNKIAQLSIKIENLSNNKIVYIAHPLSGDIYGNISKILKIVRDINIKEINVVPFVPYLADILALNDAKTEERNRGISNNLAYFQSGIVQELRVYGDFISKGVAEEIAISRKMNIPVIYFN